VIFLSEIRLMLGNKSLIWGPEARVRPQCRVITPVLAPGADSGQLTNTRNRGENSDREKDAARAPGVAGR
jgi:hypothetical protein